MQENKEPDYNKLFNDLTFEYERKISEIAEKIMRSSIDEMKFWHDFKYADLFYRLNKIKWVLHHLYGLHYTKASTILGMGFTEQELKILGYLDYYFMTENSLFKSLDELVKSERTVEHHLESIAIKIKKYFPELETNTLLKKRELIMRFLKSTEFRNYYSIEQQRLKEFFNNLSFTSIQKAILDLLLVKTSNDNEIMQKLDITEEYLYKQYKSIAKEINKSPSNIYKKNSQFKDDKDYIMFIIYCLEV